MNITPANTPPHSGLILWLHACMAMIVTMIVIGAITRLTESGLSMVEWRPLIGALPPLNEADWLREFELYKRTPEFIKKNFWMELPDFKNIYFWEWLHRLWGRLIGLVFAVPLAVFWLRGQIPAGLRIKLLIALALGGAQGFMGWYMVKSGLVDIPAVSHYRLAAHLCLALVILVWLLWITLSLQRPASKPHGGLFAHAIAALAALGLTILWGAFTAGLDAGLVYNDSFPMMGEHWVPPDFWAKDSVWMNILENHSAVQFVHRWLAMGTTAIILLLWFRARRHNVRLVALHAAALLVCAQFTLGILTLLSGIDILLATAHQTTAVLLLLALTCAHFQLRPIPRRSFSAAAA